MRPEDILHEYRVKGMTASPDGSQVVYSTQRPTLRGDGYVAQLWRMHLGTREAARLTRGPRDLLPKFSPDGTKIAFLRASDGAPQLMVLPVGGGEPYALTDQRLGVSDFSWSPDSRRIAYLSRQAEEGRYGTVELRSGDDEPARLIETVQYRSEGVGYSSDRPAQLFVVSVPEAIPEAPVTTKVATGYRLDLDAEPEVSAIPESTQLTHDGRHQLRVVYGVHAGEILTLCEVPLSMATEAVLHHADGDQPVQTVIAADAGLMILSCLPHGGDWLVNAMGLGPEGVDLAGKHVAVYRCTRDGKVSRLTEPAEHDFGELYSELKADTETSILCIERTAGTTQLVRIHLDGATDRLTEGAHEIKDAAVAGESLLVVRADATSVDEVALLEDDGTLTTLTDFSEGIREAGMCRVEELWWTADDGESVHGWVVLPEGTGPHPVLLSIHGGPHAQYTASWFDEAQVYASAGYAVVMCNPRGSAGYGEAFARAIIHRFGTVDRDDIMGFLDHALRELPGLDPERVGVMGGSYGGYMAAWLLAHEPRFRAGIVERGFLDPATFSGLSDIGWFFRSLYLGDDEAGLRAQSPYAHVDSISAPTLVIHSERDFRCPLEAAERFFYRLQRNGVDSRLLIFPGEGHELSRAGRPRHRVQRFEEILAWWELHLPVR